MGFRARRRLSGAVWAVLMAAAVFGLVRVASFCLLKHRQASSVATMRLVAAALDSYVEANRGRFPPVDNGKAPLVLPWDRVAPYVAQSEPTLEERAETYCYLGYAFQDELDAVYFLVALRKGLLTGPHSDVFIYGRSLELPDFKDGPAVHAMRAGIWRHVLRPFFSPPAIPAGADFLPVLWEPPSVHGGRGGAVLYGDSGERSTVQWVDYPGKFPMVPEFIEAVEEIRRRWYCLVDYPVGSASEKGYLYQVGRMVLVPFPHQSLFDRRIALAKNDHWKGDPSAKHWVADSRHLYGVIDAAGRSITINDLTDDVELVLHLHITQTGHPYKMEGTLRFRTPVTAGRFLSGERSFIRSPGRRREYAEEPAEQIARVKLERISSEISVIESPAGRAEGCTAQPANNRAP